MHVEVKNATVSNPREYKGEMWGEQQAALCADDLDYPIPFKINRRASEPLQPGKYPLLGSGFGADDRGNLRLNKVRIGERLAAAQQKP
jgi:hypothetical protein